MELTALKDRGPFSIFQVLLFNDLCTVLLMGAVLYMIGSEEMATGAFLLLLFCSGFALGGIIFRRLSFLRPELGVVPAGFLGTAIFSFDLFLTRFPDHVSMNGAGGIPFFHLFYTTNGGRIAIDLFMISLSCGLLTVPLHVLAKWRSRAKHRSPLLGGKSMLSALFVAAAAGVVTLLVATESAVYRLFLVLSLFNLFAAFYMYRVIPQPLLRFICWILANVMYRVEVRGRENLPAVGPAVLVCNHVSFVDWLMVAGACQRPVRFVMHYSFMAMPVAGRIFRDGGVIPIAGAFQDRDMLRSAFDRIDEELRAGEIVCIFPEGRITTDGRIRKFRPGLEWIVERTPVPVIPMRLDGLWGSFFSKKYGKPMSKPFQRFRSRISITIGKPVSPEEATAQRLHQLVSELGAGRE